MTKKLTPARPTVILTTNISIILVRAQIGVSRLHNVLNSMANVMTCFPPKISDMVPAGI
jgi:hypothetical protein